MVIPIGKLIELINARKNRVLLVAESSLCESQFKAFRKILLMEFGEKGLEGDFQRIDAEQSFRNGHGRE